MIILNEDGRKKASASFLDLAESFVEEEVTFSVVGVQVVLETAVNVHVSTGGLLVRGWVTLTPVDCFRGGWFTVHVLPTLFIGLFQTPPETSEVTKVGALNNLTAK